MDAPALACPDCGGTGTVALLTTVVACDCRAAAPGTDAEFATLALGLSVRSRYVLRRTA